MNYRIFQNPDVKRMFSRYPNHIRNRLMFIRELIFQIAENSENIGKIEETLKWAEPSYLTYNPKSGTTIRLSSSPADDDKYVLSVHCQTSLIPEFKDIYPELEYDGNRSIIFDINTKLPIEATKHFILSALTYHNRKKQDIGT